MKRRFKFVALGLGVVVILVISFLAWVIYTEAGLRFVVARLPEKLGKVTLKIEGVRGTIAGGFSAVAVDVDRQYDGTVDLTSGVILWNSAGSDTLKFTISIRNC
jgi:autotransporter translocation and assembly factor TamB